MDTHNSTLSFFKSCGKAVALGAVVIAIGYPFIGEPAEWVGLLVFAGFMGD
ncbi:MAG TPA: hypothetical protein VNT02_09275 [Burkholderiales bacterium]|nr:hypothetical protein [Burkholderiales bacterium]